MKTLTQRCSKRCRSHHIDLVVLAGFLSVLGPSVIAAYPRRILNVHPALIPSFCGPGMYGLRPHEAALARGCKVTGATVHFVNEECDGGPILLQKAVDILPGDTPEVLQKRVMEQAEWKLLPKAVAHDLQWRDRVKTPSVTPDGVPPPSRREARLPLRGGCRRRRLEEFRNRRI